VADGAIRTGARPGRAGGERLLVNDGGSEGVGGGGEQGRTGQDDGQQAATSGEGHAILHARHRAFRYCGRPEPCQCNRYISSCMSITLRHIAARLGVSVATVSRALREDPRVRPETARRVLAAVAATGYQPDPVVSAGMAKIRRRDFYRETLAWCGDCPRGEQPWVAPRFRAVEDYGARLGYGVEYYHFERPTPRALARLASIWWARGICGVLLGPLRAGHAELPFPWDGL